MEFQFLIWKLIALFFAVYWVIRLFTPKKRHTATPTETDKEDQNNELPNRLRGEGL